MNLEDESSHAELELLKSENFRLNLENSKLREICCFIDDERKKAKKFSTEWQQLGQETILALKQELEIYREKMDELKQRQRQLVQDNTELRHLCFYLDGERKHSEEIGCPHCYRIFVTPESVQQLLKKMKTSRTSEDEEQTNQAEESHYDSARSTTEELETSIETDENQTAATTPVLDPAEANVQKLKATKVSPHVKEIISIYEKTSDLADNRDDLKAILEEMCSVVLKTLNFSVTDPFEE